MGDAAKSKLATTDERAVRALERIADALSAIASDRRSRKVAAKRGHATATKRVTVAVEKVYRPTELDKARARKLLGRS